MKNKRIRQREAGFSLLEMLFVLMIVMLLASIAVPFIHQQMNKYEIDQFLRVFDADILFAQNQSLGNREIWIHLFKDRYVVKEKSKPHLYTRYYPKGFHIQNLIHRRISFDNKGTIEDPFSYLFRDQADRRIKIVFPLGKGRQYFETF